jgi:hypothetical protein
VSEDYAARVQQPAQPPAWDEGNQLLGGGPAQLTTRLVDTPGGQALAMTVRTNSATVTVFLVAADAKTWAAQMTRDSAGMSGSGLVIANGTVKPP